MCEMTHAELFGPAWHELKKNVCVRFMSVWFTTVLKSVVNVRINGQRRRNKTSPHGFFTCVLNAAKTQRHSSNSSRRIILCYYETYIHSLVWTLCRFISMIHTALIKWMLRIWMNHLSQCVIQFLTVQCNTLARNIK